VLADQVAALGTAPRWAVIEAARRSIANARAAILAGGAMGRSDPRTSPTWPASSLEAATPAR